MRGTGLADITEIGDHQVVTYRDYRTDPLRSICEAHTPESRHRSELFYGLDGRLCLLVNYSTPGRPAWSVYTTA